MTILNALRLYPKAVAWSLLLSTAIIMEGYDTALITNFFALDSFNKQYGSLQEDGTYVISAPWRTGFTVASACGAMIGLWAAGLFQEKYGYKLTMIVSLVSLTAFIAMTVFAENAVTQVAGQVLCGVPWGVFQTLTTAYASDVCPVALRAYLTTYVNLCWIIGQLIASGVLRAMVGVTGDWGFRLPFALQWIWPLPILIGSCLAPESPYWLVQMGRIEEARHSLKRLTTAGDPSFSIDQTIAMIECTNEMEKEATAGLSYFDCFKGSNLRRTEIVCGVYQVQELCGSGIMAYSTVFFEEAGLPTTQSFNMSMVQYALGVIGGGVAWWLMVGCGRRTLYVWGTWALFVVMMATGFCGIVSNQAASWAAGALLLLYAFIYNATLGPVCFSLVAEIPSTRLKSKTIILSRNLYNATGIVINILVNYQLTSTAWNWGAKSGFFWGGLCFFCGVWCQFRVPEPKGRTYAELDVLFERKISARKFKETEVHIFDGAEADVINGLEMDTVEPTSK